MIWRYKWSWLAEWSEQDIVDNIEEQANRSDYIRERAVSLTYVLV